MRRVSFYLLAAFFVVQLIGLAIGYQFIAQELSIVEDPEDVANSLMFFVYILAATAGFLLVLKYYKGRNFFLGLELLMELLTIQIALAVLTGGWLPWVGALALVAFRLKFPQYKTYFLAFASAVVGALIGASLDLLPALVLAGLLAGYDFIAVFYTKHMVSLAKGLSDRGAAFAINVKHKKDKIMLGTGDLVLPAMLNVAAMKASLAAPFFGLAGAMLGMTVLIYALEKRKGYWPALPPLVGGTVLGLAVYYLISLYCVI